VLVSGDANQACGSNYVTEHYLRASYGGEEGCVQAQSSKNAASSVDVNAVSTAGRSGVTLAKAKVVPDGGLNDGEKLTVTLVKEDADWKVDELKSNAPVGP
jgi:hypothetical protein